MLKLGHCASAARGRAGEAGHPEATSGVVRRPARSRPRAPRLHRRDLGLHEHGPAVRTSAPRPAPAGQRASRSLENHHLRRRAAAHRPSRALRARWSDQPRRVRGLRREGSRPGAEARRRGGHGQPVEPQGAKRASADRGRRSDAALLPPHSPDFNPIENAFAKLKALLRKAAERTIDGLWAAIGRLIDTFTPSECANYFTAAGYDAT